MGKLTRSALLPLAALLALGPGVDGAAQATEEDGGRGVQITYLANEGFLLEAGETAVLVDALFGDGLAEYPRMPDAVRSDLENARGRFAAVDLILVSHAHADHFDPAAVARHLRANPEAVFLSSAQAVEAVAEELGEEAARHDMIGADPGEGKSARLELAGVSVQALDLHHGRLPIRNLGLVISLGGVDVLHVGDTSADAADLRPHAALLETVDVWMLPDWLMGDADWEAARGRAAGPTWLVNMHLAAPNAPPDWFGSAGSHARRVARIREALPGAWVPLDPLESRRFPAPAD